MVSKEEFDILSGKVNDLYVKMFQDQDSSAPSKDDFQTLERKLEHLEGTLIPDLKLRIKTVKKSIPSDAALPLKNKETLEQVRAGLERARAKIAVLEQPKQDQRFKLSDSSIGTLFGKYVKCKIIIINSVSLSIGKGCFLGQGEVPSQSPNCRLQKYSQRHLQRLCCAVQNWSWKLFRTSQDGSGEMGSKYGGG